MEGEREQGGQGRGKQVGANEQLGVLWKGKIMKLEVCVTHPKTRPSSRQFLEITKLQLFKTENPKI